MTGRVADITDIEAQTEPEKTPLIPVCDCAGDDPPDAENAPKPWFKVSNWYAAAAISLCCGFLFGFAMQKSFVYVPSVLRGQFRFSNFVMLKIFMAASAVGSISLAVLSVAMPATFCRTMRGSYLNDRGVPSAFLGGALIGIGGFVVAGSCPGTVYAQLGSAVTNSPFTFLGGLFGAGVYGFLFPYMRGFATWGAPKKATVDAWLGVPFLMVAIPSALVCSGIVLVLELYRNSEDDSVPGMDANIITSPAWPAYAAGALIGLLQLPMSVLLQKTLGASTSFVVVIGTAMHTILPKKTMQEANWTLYFRRMHIFKPAGWQAMSMLGLVLGSLAASTASDSWRKQDGVTIVEGFFGGAIMVFGGRLGGGCTSGHGLSGVSKLQFASVAAAMGMFGAAIPFAYLYHYLT